MKYLSFFPSVIKATVGVVAFLVGIGWAAFISVHAIVKAEGKDIRQEVKAIRDIDMQHIDKRFDRIETLIRENK